MQVIATVLAMFGLVIAGTGDQAQTDVLAFGTDVSTTQVGSSDS